MITTEENLGGAGGFHRGMQAAYEQGYDRIWLLDDDVVPAPDCLSVLLAVDEELSDCLMVVREDTSGRLVEKAARHVRPPQPAADQAEDGDGRDDVRHSCGDAGAGRAGEHPLRRLPGPSRVVEAIGLPDPGFFIFYDDVDFALRARRAGFRICAVRDAVLVRQLEFDQQLDLAGWKGYYMYRNLFTDPPAGTARTRWSAPSPG